MEECQSYGITEQREIFLSLILRSVLNYSLCCVGWQCDCGVTLLNLTILLSFSRRERGKI
jgi:hypothetical protein